MPAPSLGLAAACNTDVCGSPYAGESTHLVRLHVAFSHQPYQNLVLQVPFLAAQTIGKSQNVKYKIDK